MFSLSDLGKQKKTKKVTIGETTLTVTELPMTLTIKLGKNKRLLASAIAKIFQRAQTSSQELITEKTPIKDMDMFMETSRSLVAEPNENLVAKELETKEQGISDLIELVLDSGLQYSLLKGAVVEFSSISEDDLKESEDLTLPMVVKLVAAILELNVGDFQTLGNSLSPLTSLLGRGTKNSETKEQ